VSKPDSRKTKRLSLFNSTRRSSYIERRKNDLYYLIRCLKEGVDVMNNEDLSIFLSSSLFVSEDLFLVSRTTHVIT
jgi:hypothetical protein